MPEQNMKDPLVGTSIAGCEIIEKIATGGMGAVYKAKHKALDRIVCVKILSPALAEDQKAVSLFLTEARAIAELDHPNIVNVYNVGRERGLYFIIMSFISGDNVSNIIRRRPNLPVGFILNIFQDVLKGLAVAHEKGIIHRDIKPSNILINEKLEAKIVDFGIAKKMDKDKSVTRTTEMAGTAYFISPEQALGGDVDVRADLYSAGATLYFMLTGQFPYRGKSSMEIIQKHINEAIPNPSDIRRDMPPWISIVVQKLMAKKPDDRFQSAQETLDYILKMRAEDQLRVKQGAGTSLDIGGETPLRVRSEKVHTATETMRLKRITENAQIQKLQKGENAGVAMPIIGTQNFKEEVSRKRKDTKTESSKEKLETKSSSMNIKAVRNKDVSFREFREILTKLFFHIPIFFVITLIAMIFIVKFGAAAAGTVDPNTHPGFFDAFLYLFDVKSYMADVTLTIVACALVFALFIMSCMSAYSRAALSLLALCAFSYLTGFFGVSAGWGSAFSTGLMNMFAQDYALIYMVIGLVLSLTLMFGKPVLPLRILCSAAILLTLFFCKQFAALPLMPAETTLITLLYYSAILLAVAAVAVVLPRSFTFSSLLPLLLFILALCSIYGYMISGKVYATAAEVMEVPEVKEYIAKYGEKVIPPSSASGGKLVQLDLNFGSSLLTAASDLKDLTEKPGFGERPAPEKDPIRILASIYLSRGEKGMMRAIWYKTVFVPFDRTVQYNPDTFVFKYGALLIFLFTNVYFIIHMTLRRDL
ncbi:MAG: serine/threonine protein kinase [Elusimicrobium sp.]|jgi:serine/threonine protein kinase|nr:serine/threonine protein kinase [Elusimicrobium sp.]